MSETDIQRAILDYLAQRGIATWRNNRGRKGHVRFGLCEGASDIIGILPGGRFIAIEVKAAKGKTSWEQEEFMALVREMGGLAFVARSVEEVHEALNSIVVQ